MDFKSYLQAGYPALCMKTLEPTRAFETLAQEISTLNGIPLIWDINNGVVDRQGQKITEETDPNETIKCLKETQDNTVLFMWNLHHFLSSIEIIQSILSDLDEWKARGQCLIILAPKVELPLELDRVFTALEFELPDKKALKIILDNISNSGGIDLPPDSDSLLEIAKGLTTFEAENAFALAAIHTPPFCKKVISEQKTQMVKKNASLEILPMDDGFNTLGGLGQLKHFSSKCARSPLARGLLLLGVPGCGKSHFAKALGGELGIPTLSLDFGRLFGSLVGQSEERIRQALAVADAMAPCILMIDEIDKGLSGLGSSQSDGGVGARIFGSFLTWLNDHDSQVFTVATSNNISQLPPEFLRAERWDAVFFVDLPTEEERHIILEIHTKAYGLEIADLPDMTNWSGAEIKSLCRIAAMTKMSMKEASQFIIPLAKSMNKQIEELRTWASEKTIPASSPEKSKQGKRTRFRKISSIKNKD